MELEQMQLLWTELSSKLEKQQALTDSLIIKMTETNYRNRLNKIYVPEIIGSLVCLAGVMYLLANFQKLNSGYLLACTLILTSLLIALPALSLNAICKMRSLNISAGNYKDILTEFSKRRLRFMGVQKISFFLSPLIMITMLPVIGQLKHIPAFLNAGKLGIWYLACLCFFVVFAMPVYKHYRKVTRKMEDVLKELEE